MAPLAAYVERLRAQLGRSDVPDFDPLDGGVRARMLLLLKAPGPGAVAGVGGSGLVSMDNADPTARNLLALVREAGLAREELAFWNIVPWYVGEGGAIREVRDGRAHLREVLALLPNLHVVVTLGEWATRGWAPLRSQYPDVVTLFSWHPSSRGLAGHPERRDHVLDTLKRARAHSKHALAEQALDPRGPAWLLRG